MNTQSAFPFALQWTPAQIADAVPLRLFELVDVAALPDAPTASNDARRRCAGRDWRGGYRANPAMPALVRVH